MPVLPAHYEPCSAAMQWVFVRETSRRTPKVTQNSGRVSSVRAPTFERENTSPRKPMPSLRNAEQHSDILRWAESHSVVLRLLLNNRAARWHQVNHSAPSYKSFAVRAAVHIVLQAECTIIMEHRGLEQCPVIIEWLLRLNCWGVGLLVGWWVGVWLGWLVGWVCGLAGGLVGGLLECWLRGWVGRWGLFG